MELFVDILQERRKSSDVAWALRPWNGKVAYKRNKKLNAENIKSLALKSYSLRQVLYQISSLKNIPVFLLSSEAEKILDEIGFKREVSVLRGLSLFVSKILKKLYTAIYVNEKQFLKIKSEMGNNPVIFVPSHRSYCDFIFMSYICFYYEVDIPRIAAGMDFHAMAGMGSILRSACAFFMRRSFNNDEIYSAVFSQYVETLISDGDAAVEFFIEGTRSRTGKSIMPKYGFLSMTLKPFFVGLVPDVTLIPVTISYDRVLEEVLFAYELLGVPKPKESTRGFLKALSILKENYGNAYVQFGYPISVKSYISDKIDRSIHGHGSVAMQQISSEESKQITLLAHTVVQKQKELTVLNCFNLIAAVLNNNILSSSKLFTVDDLTIEVTWLLDIFQTLTPSSSTLAINSINKEYILFHLKLHQSLIFISGNDEIQLCRVHNNNLTGDKKNLKGHNLSESTMDIAVPLIVLQYYCNPCAPFLVTLCFVILTLQDLSQEDYIYRDHLFDEFKFLASVFSHEFALHLDFIEKEFEKALRLSETLNIILRADENQIKKGNNEKLSNFCINFISSYIPCYLAVIEFLLKFDREFLKEKEILSGCQEILESKLKIFVLHPANLSLDSIKNALQSFISMKAVFKVKKEKDVEFQVSHCELERVYSKLVPYHNLPKWTSYSTQYLSTFIKNNL